MKLDEYVSESGMLVEPTKEESSLNVMEVGELELDDLVRELYIMRFHFQ